jgi:hypothetical protein
MDVVIAVGGLATSAVSGALGSIAAYLPALPVSIASGVATTVGTALASISVAAIVRRWRGGRNANR